MNPSRDLCKRTLAYPARGSFDLHSAGLWLDQRSDIKYLNIVGDVEMLQEETALLAFAALSQEHRLQVVRLLVQAGPEGMPAGALGEKLGAGSSKMSFHLSHLEHAGLVRSRRDGRQIIYAVQIAAVSELVAFLLYDCCGGRPEICAPAFAACSCAVKEAADV